MDLNKIVLNNEYQIFVIQREDKNTGAKLVDNQEDDGYVLLDAEQLVITNKAFDAVEFILTNEYPEEALKYAIYSRDTDSVDVQGEHNVSTGNALIYAQGLETDSDEVKAMKLQSILALKDFRIMCENIY